MARKPKPMEHDKSCACSICQDSLSDWPRCKTCQHLDVEKTYCTSPRFLADCRHAGYETPEAGVLVYPNFGCVQHEEKA